MTALPNLTVRNSSVRSNNFYIIAFKLAERLVTFVREQSHISGKARICATDSLSIIQRIQLVHRIVEQHARLTVVISFADNLFPQLFGVYGFAHLPLAFVVLDVANIIIYRPMERDAIAVLGSLHKSIINHN